MPEPILPGTDELYRLLVENVTDYAIILLDPGGRVASWNVGAERQLGWPEAEVLGRSFAAFYPPEEAAGGTPARDLATAAAQGRCETIAWRVRGDGTRIWTSVVLTALRDAGGRVVGFGQITRDLTERREVAHRYEESRQRYRSLFENHPSAICSLDLDGTVRTANPAAAALVGYPEHDMVALGPWPVVASEGRATVRALFRRAAAGRPGHGDVTLLHREGRRVAARLTVVPIRVEGETIGVYAIAEDVTERRRAEADREALLVRERVARAEAEAALRAKTDFLSVVSHELKTPLNAVTGFADLLADGEAGPVTELQRRYLGRIQDRSRRLLGLIEEVLDYTRLESHADGLRLEATDLGQVVHEAVREVAPALRAKGLEMAAAACPPGAYVTLADPARVRRLLRALLSNAAKFTEAGAVSLSVRREGALLAVEVRDTGIGIEPHDLPRIWEPFWQAEHPLTRAVGGTGLGLSLARRLAELMGGDIAAQSTPGEGSVFTVRLPVHAAGG